MLESIKSLSPPIDGIYYTDRKETEFDYKINGLINKIVKRSEDMVNLRGFVLDNACDFEVRICSALEICWQKLSDQQKDTLDTTTRSIISQLCTDKQKRYLEILKKDYSRLYPAAVKHNSPLTHTDKLKLLENILKILSENYGFVSSGKYVDFRANYEHDFSNYRNALGHRKDDDSTIMIRGKSVDIDQELHRQLRATVHEYNDLISQIENHITQNM